MAGEGFARHGSTSLNENMKLLKRKRIFEKERSFLNLKNQIFMKNSDHIRSPQLSETERMHYQNKTKHSFAKDQRVTGMIAIVGVVVIIIITLNLYVKTGQREISIKQYNQELKIKEKVNSYEYYIKSGDQWYQEKKYYNAAFQYRLALEVFPNDVIAREKLIRAYDANCFYDNRNCGKSEALLQSVSVD